MIFNPLFLSTSNSVQELKNIRFANPNYLFTDIIKLNSESSTKAAETQSPSFSSLIKDITNNNEFIISGASANTKPENNLGIAGYKLNEKEISGVLTELIHNAQSISIKSNGKSIKDIEIKGEEAPAMLRKVITELENSGKLTLDIKSDDSEFSIELQGLNIKTYNTYDLTEGYTEEQNLLLNGLSNTEPEALKETSKPGTLDVIVHLLTDSKIYNSIKSKLSPELKKILSSQGSEDKTVKFLMNNPSEQTKIVRLFEANKEVIVGKIKNTILRTLRDGDTSNLNKLEEVAKHINDNNFSDISQLFNLVAKTEDVKILSVGTTEENKSVENIESIPWDVKVADKADDFVSSIMEEVKDDVTKYILTFYQQYVANDSIDNITTKNSANPFNPDVDLPLIKSGDDLVSAVNANPSKLAEILPEVKELLKFVDNKEIVQKLVQDPNILEVVKTRSKMSQLIKAGNETEFNAANLESDLKNILKGSGKDFSENILDVIQKYRLDKPSNKNEIQSDQTIKPVLEAVLSKLNESATTGTELKSFVKELINSPLPVEKNNLKGANDFNKFSQLNRPNDQIAENITKNTVDKFPGLININEVAKNEELQKTNEFIFKITYPEDKQENKQSQLTQLITKNNKSVEATPESKLKEILTGKVNSKVNGNSEQAVKESETTASDGKFYSKNDLRIIQNLSTKNPLKITYAQDPVDLKSTGIKDNVVNSVLTGNVLLNKTAGSQITDMYLGVEEATVTKVSNGLGNIKTEDKSEIIKNQPVITQDVIEERKNLNVEPLTLVSAKRIISTQIPATYQKIASEKTEVPKEPLKPHLSENNETIESPKAPFKPVVELKESTVESWGNKISAPINMKLNADSEITVSTSRLKEKSDVKISANPTESVQQELKSRSELNSKPEVNTKQDTDSKAETNHKVAQNNANEKTVQPLTNGVEDSFVNIKNVFTKLPDEGVVPEISDNELAATGNIELKKNGHKVTAATEEPKPSDSNKPNKAINEANDNSQKVSSGQNTNNESGGSQQHETSQNRNQFQQVVDNARSGQVENVSFENMVRNVKENSPDIERRVKEIKDVELAKLNGEIQKLTTSKTSQHVSLKLTPGNLGKVDLKIEIIDKIINAKIEVENENVRHIVQQGMEQLKSALNQQGLVPNNINVSLAGSEDKNQRFARNKKRNNNGEFEENNKKVQEEAAQKNMGYNTYDFIA